MAWKKNTWGEKISGPPKQTIASARNSTVKPSTLVVVTVLIAVLGTVLVWLFRAGDSAPMPQEKPVVAKKAKPARIKPQSSKRALEVVVASNVAVSVRRESVLTNDIARIPGQMTLPDGRVLRFPTPKEGEYRIVHSHGKTYKCDHLGNWEDVTPKPIFDNSFEENLIGLSMDGGHFMPGMLMGLDQKTVMAMLNKKVVVNPDDPEDVVEKKKAVAEAKGIILDYIKQGGTFEQFVMEMRDLSVQERKVKSIAMKDIVGLLKEGRVEDAAYYRRSLDHQLVKEGLSPVKLPSHITGILEQVKATDEVSNEESK